MTTTQPNAIGVPDYTAELPCVPESVGRARALVAGVLAAWGMDDDLADRGKVIVSELLTNAVLHTETARSKVIIERRDGSAVRIGVSDRSHVAPRVESPAANTENGRGMRLVAGLSVRWSYDTHRWGKVTWAEIEAPAGRQG